jgi:predicted alpha/beta hydrolase family esterase
MHFVTIPGIDGSDHEHWQSIWEAEWGQRASRISVSSWASPELDDWCDAIDRAVLRAGSAGLHRRPAPVGVSDLARGEPAQSRRGS